MRSPCSTSLPPGKAGWRAVLPLVLAALVLAACRGSGSQDLVTPTDMETLAYATVTPSPAPEPQQVLLVLPPGSEDDFSRRLEAAIQQLGERDSLVVQKVSDLPAKFDESQRTIIMIYPDESFLAVVRRYPDRTFIAVAAESLPAEPNMWILGNSGSGMDQAAFLSGYIAAMLTPDWRIGALQSFETRGGRQLDRAFINGGVFFCGLCRPAFPPYFSYPAYVALNELSDRSARAALVTAEEMGLQVVWVAPELRPLLDALQLPAGFSFLGTSEPSSNLAGSWIATVRPAPEQRLEELWEAILAGAPAELVPIPIVIENVNSSVLTPGRLGQADQIRLELEKGYIGTGAIEE